MLVLLAFWIALAASPALGQEHLLDNLPYPAGQPLTSHGWTEIRNGSPTLVTSGSLALPREPGIVSATMNGRGEATMAQPLLLEVEMPDDLQRFRLPPGVDDRLTRLLDRQDRGEQLSADERSEAEGLVELAELLSLLRLRSSRHWRDSPG